MVAAQRRSGRGDRVLGMSVVSAQSAAQSVDCAAWGCPDEALCGSEYCRRHLVLPLRAKPDADDDVIDDDADADDGETLATLAGRLVRSSKNLDRSLRIRRSARLDAEEALAEFNSDLRALRGRAARMLKA